MLNCSLKPLSRFYLLAVLFSAVFCCASAAQGQTQGQTQGPTQGPTIGVGGETTHDVSPPLRDLMKGAPPVPQIEEEAEEVKLIPLPSGFKPAHVPDRALQPPFAAAAASAAATPLALTHALHFDGFGPCLPPR